MRRLFQSPAWPWIAAAAMLGLAGGLAAAVIPSANAGARGHETVMSRLLGSSAQAFGDSMLDRADTAFHMGRESRPDRTAITNDLFQTWREQIRPTGHAHLAGDRVKDIMAWLRFASWIDPSDVRSVLIASYWMAGDMQRPREALRILLEAQAEEPGSYLPYLGRSRIYAKLDERAMARRCYDRVLRLWPGGLDPKDEDVKFDKREALSRRALLNEMEGRTAEAIRDMMDIVTLFPERASGQFKRRIAQLARGETPGESAEQRWTALRSERMAHAEDEEESGAHDHAGHAHLQGRF